jgi:hypothetical protein
MRGLGLAVCAALLSVFAASGVALAAGAEAGSKSGTVVATTPASGVPTVPLTRDGKPKAKELRAACKAQAETKGLKGKDAKDAWIACYRAGRPDLAKRFDCRKEAKAKGLKDDELKAAYKACSAKG